MMITGCTIARNAGNLPFGFLVNFEKSGRKNAEAIELLRTMRASADWKNVKNPTASCGAIFLRCKASAGKSL
jgi:hypothetical protein